MTKHTVPEELELRFVPDPLFVRLLDLAGPDTVDPFVIVDAELEPDTHVQAWHGGRWHCCWPESPARVGVPDEIACKPGIRIFKVE